MIQGNYRQYWLRKDFSDIQTAVDEFFAEQNKDDATLVQQSFRCKFGHKHLE